MTKRKHKRMYAVSKDGIGLIAGTMSYSRKAAIQHFCGASINPNAWENFKHTGYRTVMARVEVTRIAVGGTTTPSARGASTPARRPRE